MYIEISAPAILPLAFARVKHDERAKAVILGVALQHPPIHFLAEKYDELHIHGPRAHVARMFAERYLQQTGFPASAEIQIENTIPSLVGYGSDPILALSVASALSWVNEETFEDIAKLSQQVILPVEDALAYWGFAEGGILLVELEAADGEMPALLRRHELKHKDNKAWAFIFFFPKVPSGIPESLESDRQVDLQQVALHLPDESGTLIEEVIWPALEQDDIDAFGNGLMQLKKMNDEALAQARPIPDTDVDSQKIFGVFQEVGAVAWGGSLTGIGLFGLVRGAQASRDIRARLLRAIGYMSGHFDVTITNNEGAQHVVKEMSIHEYDYKPSRPGAGIGGHQA